MNHVDLNKILDREKITSEVVDFLHTFEDKKVFTMNGHRGQFVIVFPEEDIIIVRLGDKNKEGDNDDGDLYKYISEGYNLSTSIE